MKKLIPIVSCVMLALVLFTSCFDDEPDYLTGGKFRLTMDDGYTISDGKNSLLTLSADYPFLKVASIFSLTAKAPEIAYLGQFHDLVEIPLTTDEVFSTQAAIHNQGGYLITMKVIKPGQSEPEKCIIKLLVKEGPFYSDDAPAYLDIEYNIYK